MAILVLELGGKDVAIVRPDADLEQASKLIVSGALSYSGQRCTAVKRVFTQSSNQEGLTKLITEKVNALTVGPAKGDNFITPLINKAAADYVKELIEDAISKGAKAETPVKYEGNLIHPVVLSGVTPDMRVAWEEQFGPIIPILTVDSDEQAIELANKSKYGLQSSIFSKDVDKAVSMAHQLEVGSLNINGAPSRGPDVLPFTGVKKSGLNVQGIKYSIETMTRTFNIVKNS